MKILYKQLFLFFLLIKTVCFCGVATGQKTLRFLLVGDVIGKAGQNALTHTLTKLRKTYNIDAVIVNGENAMENGLGISAENVNFFKQHEVLAITSGNHVWENKDVYNILQKGDYLLRPANYSNTCIGKGYGIFSVNGHTVAIINLMGRVFFNDALDCPFKTAQQLLHTLQSKTNIILVDFHAEATYEKAALGSFLEGEVSVVYGTHTHIQTADEQILNQGTAYITDVGMIGPKDSVIGLDKETIIKNYLTNQTKSADVPKTGPCLINAIYLEIDSQTTKAKKITRINKTINI